MIKYADFILLGVLFACLFYNVCLKQEESSGTFAVSSCSCEISCTDDDIFPSSAEYERQKNIPVVWKTLKHNSLDFSEFCTVLKNIRKNYCLFYARSNMLITIQALLKKNVLSL